MGKELSFLWLKAPREILPISLQGETSKIQWFLKGYDIHAISEVILFLLYEIFWKKIPLHFHH